MIGPALPPHLRKKSADVDDEERGRNIEDSDDDSYGPALPPALAARRAAPRHLDATPDRVVEPTAHNDNVDDEDDEDDIVGPQLPSSTATHDPEDGVREFLEREQRRKMLAEEEKKPKPLQREEWMLAPPSASEALRSLDPTRIKSRQFSKATGREEVSKDTSVWTETPAERQTRLAEELSGKRKRPSATSGEDDEQALKRRKMEADLKKNIEEHNKIARPSSLLEIHQTAQASKPQSTEHDVIWDRDRDMGSGGRLMDEKSRSKLISDSRSLGDRFSSSKRGGYND